VVVVAEVPGARPGDAARLAPRAQAAVGEALGLRLEALVLLPPETLPKTTSGAIVGMACRFPRSPDLAAFWRLLDDAVDATSSVPADRWDSASYHDPDPAAPGKSVTARGAFLDDVRGFEPLFFGISPREADELDPQQRLALELTWEALEDAGLPPRGLAGSATAVFFGAMWHDWADLTHADLRGMTSHRATGISNNLIANRVSYALGLRGPSAVLDTACSSALVAAHLAVQALRSGDAELAIVGAVNLLLAPESMVFCSKFGGLAPDGRCKAFDSRADGFGRGEGGGVVVLRRLSGALAAGDRIWAVLRGSAVNNDGASQGLTAPKPPRPGGRPAPRPRTRRAPGRRAPRRRGARHRHLPRRPDRGHRARRRLRRGSPAGRPLLVGSVKTNIGHTEGAAGIAGLIKAALCLREGQVPPNLHFTLRRTRTCGWTAPAWRSPPRCSRGRPARRPRVAGVSSFGFGGTNACSATRWARSRPHTSPAPSP
jgi:acyl transferase domain-containing protein